MRTIQRNKVHSLRRSGQLEASGGRPRVLTFSSREFLASTGATVGEVTDLGDLSESVCDGSE